MRLSNLMGGYSTIDYEQIAAIRTLSYYFSAKLFLWQKINSLQL